MLPAIQGNPGSRLAAGDAQSCRFASLASVGGIGWSHLASFHASHIFRFVNFLLEKLAVARNGGKTVKEGVEGRGREGQGGRGGAGLDHL